MKFIPGQYLNWTPLFHVDFNFFKVLIHREETRISGGMLAFNRDVTLVSSKQAYCQPSRSFMW